MRAIQRLKQSGMTRAQIATALNVSRHAVRFWEVGERSPSHDNRQKLIELAEARGVLLLASDFSMTNTNESDS
jgi:DNA-binding transcriptional regulator YiaG